jgi:hypothetical protein
VDGAHDRDTLCSVVAVTTRLVGADGGVQSAERDDWARRRDEPHDRVSIRTAVNREGDVLVMESSP